MSNDVFAGFNRGPANPNEITMKDFASDNSSNSSRRRLGKYSQAIQAAANYKMKRAAENQVDAQMGMGGSSDDDDNGTKGFKIDKNTTVVEGYRDKGFVVPGVKGSSPLGPIGAAVGIFNPALGAGISGVGNYLSS